MNLQRAHDPVGILREVIHDLRIIGPLFCFLGIWPLFIAIGSGAPRVNSHLLAALDSILLIGPGIWYLIVAGLLKRRQFNMLRPTMWVAIGQAAVVLGLLGLRVIVRWNMLGGLIVPVILALFFTPAVLGTLWHLWRLEGVASSLLPTETAFEPVRVQAIAEATLLGEKGSHE